jgi:rubrerythrin
MNVKEKIESSLTDESEGAKEYRKLAEEVRSLTDIEEDTKTIICGALESMAVDEDKHYQLLKIMSQLVTDRA